MRQLFFVVGSGAVGGLLVDVWSWESEFARSTALGGCLGWIAGIIVGDIRRRWRRKNASKIAGLLTYDPTLDDGQVRHGVSRHSG